MQKKNVHKLSKSLNELIIIRLSNRNNIVLVRFIKVVLSLYLKACVRLAFYSKCDRIIASLFFFLDFAGCVCALVILCVFVIPHKSSPLRCCPSISHVSHNTVHLCPNALLELVQSGQKMAKLANSLLKLRERPSKTIGSPLEGETEEENK